MTPPEIVFSITFVLGLMAFGLWWWVWKDREAK